MADKLNYSKGKKEKVAIITGSSRGIGRAIALELAKDNINVIINYLNSEDKAKKVVDEIKDNGGNAAAIKADVSNFEEVKRLADKTKDIFGPIDILINNAGEIVRPGDWKIIDDNTWERTINVNLRGVFNCIKMIAPDMINQKSGKIINISSTYGIIGAAPVIAYTAAKAGVINLTLSFAKELAPYITVNAVAPGNINTEMTSSSGEEFMKSTIEATPLKRLGEPEDVAYAVSFLASKKADFITGQVIIVDGGHILR